MAAPKRGGGRLIESVAFDKRATVSDGYGNTEGDFVQQFQCRAGFVWLRGGESVIAARMEGKQPLVVMVRRQPNTELIRPDWRMRDLRDGDKVYAVHAVAESDDRGYLDVLVEAGVAA